ncbi:MAG: sugar transferase [Actinomycetota bacterium]|nr:sugar transferase [Actinomycetota bacterium]
MRRLARPLLFGGTAVAVVGLSKAHAVSHGYDYTDSSRFAWSLAYVLFLVGASYGAGLPDLARTRRSAVLSSVGALSAATACISALQLVAGSALLPRFVVLGAPLVLLPFYVLCSVCATDGRARDGQRDRVVVVAGIDEGFHLADELAAEPERPAVLSRVLSPEWASSRDSGSRPLVDAVMEEAATAVVLDRVAQADDSIVAQAADLHEAGIRVRTLSLFYEQWLGKLPVSELERVSLMFDIGEVHRARYGRMKRILDTTAGLVGVAVLAVVTPAVLLGNLFGNRGPLLYRQPRVGKNGRVFEIVKFRTMRPDHGTTEWTANDDPRITPFGAWLRRTHLDELPQAVNILRGHLSIVGPRPEQPKYVEELEGKIPFYRLRHLVRPGLTGWAQVKYPYGANQADAIEKLQYEFYYLRHQGLALDMRVIGRTVRSVLGRGGR